MFFICSNPTLHLIEKAFLIGIPIIEVNVYLLFKVEIVTWSLGDVPVTGNMESNEYLPQEKKKKPVN